jgi:hypothetical protein
MKYPEWAPTSLVERHKNRVDSNAPEREFKTRDPDAVAAAFAQKHEGITEDAIEDYRRWLYRFSSGLPDEEGTALLGKLITDPRMKDVWKALAKRMEEDSELYQFFRVCEIGITGWRGDMKQTAAERKAFYQDIRDTALKLISLMNKAGQFDLYSTSRIAKYQSIEGLTEGLDAPNELSYARFHMSVSAPRVTDVLVDISEKATRYREEEYSVKKPNSENADIHYFVRRLSEYLKERYGQPLHEVVAATTEVVFDRQNIDSDYVRKLVGSYPEDSV